MLIRFHKVKAHVELEARNVNFKPLSQWPRFPAFEYFLSYSVIALIIALSTVQTF